MSDPALKDLAFEDLQYACTARIGHPKSERSVTVAPYARLGPVPSPVIRITVDGKRAETVDMAATRKGVGVSSMRGEISRHKVPHIPGMEDAVGGKKKLYWIKDIDVMWKQRPGIGSPGRRRKVAE